ncbi:glycosyltransferase [Pseudoalteromonas gelatinilytica]|uniref:glycosyltransferase n=1 Tax=Pseudoalteromonas gelatinilytica TaxID=1703256 RepID=UPI0007C51F4C|nr:glycosyltransferase [Pseudoalteromonas gelatinilytica]
MTLNKKTIVHITESFGGGVTTAINTYVKNSPSFAHHLIAVVREGDETGEEESNLFASSTLLKRDFTCLKKCLHRIDDLKPDVIHIHSTYAGLFLRIHPKIDTQKVVYTPHGFAFLRDDHPILKKAYYLIEKVLSKRCKVIAGCGVDEANIAQAFNKNLLTYPLVNICEKLDRHKLANKSERPLKIGMVGRITAQKGYDFFAKVAKKLTGKAEFIWIGGGDEKGNELLSQAGVRVTGWVKRQSVLDELEHLDVYFHTAAWDGFPVSVLEAAEMNLPVLLREIGPFTAEGLNTLADEDIASNELLLFLNGDKTAVDRANFNTSMIRNTHTAENLSNSISTVYGYITG